MKEMVGRLRGVGVELDFDDVLKAAGPDRVSVGRPHLARALVAVGAARSVQDAFNRYIADDRRCYVPVDLVTPTEAVSVILEAGGIPVWAHPPAHLAEVLLPSLVGAGLRGLEVYRPSHTPGEILRLEELCHAHDLLASGGSDWHSPDSGSALGDFFVDAFEIEALLDEGGF